MDKTSITLLKATIRKLLIVLSALVVVGVVMLIRSPKEEGPAVVLEPDYATIEKEPSAKPMENTGNEVKPEVSQGGGSVTISFTDDIRYSMSGHNLSLYYQNPYASTHNVVVQVILISGEDQYLLAQSGILEPGYEVTSLVADSNAPKLSVGGYEGKLKLLFYDSDTGERAIVDTDIPCVITVVE